jgi:hypothetical protein
VAERSGDTAFEADEGCLHYDNFRASESGVALRFPPQSKTPPMKIESSASGPEMRGNLGMNRHLESCQQRLTARLQRKFLQIKFRSFAQVGDGFRHGLALGGGTRFGVESGEATFFGWN